MLPLSDSSGSFARYKGSRPKLCLSEKIIIIIIIMMLFPQENLVIPSNTFCRYFNFEMDNEFHKEKLKSPLSDMLARIDALPVLPKTNYFSTRGTYFQNYLDTLQ